MKVVVGGPSHSGKSTFAAALVDCVRERKHERRPDFSFRWETLDVTDNSLAHLLNDRESLPRHNRGVEWNEQTARTKRATFEGCDEELVVADAPGRLTPELDIVMEPADAMILLASAEKADRIDDWLDRAERFDIDVGWVLTTVLADAEPGWNAADSSDGVRRGVVRTVERDEFEAHRIDAFDPKSAEMVRRVSADLAALAAQVEA
jgi:hypothetical protein